MNNSNKYIILISLDNYLGGAQIRYLSLFKEIYERKNDYYLVLNRKLYDLAIETGYLTKETNKILILEVDRFKKVNDHTSIINPATKSLKNKPIIKALRKKKNQLKGFKKFIKYTMALNKIFKSKKPGYVYAIWIGGMIAWPLKYKFKFKLVYSYMDSGFSSLDSFLNAPLKSEVNPLRQAHIIDFLSEDLFKILKQKVNLNKKTKIAITPCSFKNYENISASSKKFNQVVFSSRLTPIKNPLLFLKSIKILSQNYPADDSIEFIILGDGSCMPELVAFKEAHNLSNVIFKGQVDNPVDYLRQSRVFVSIQQTNNYPSQSLLEAMACENAIIASDVGETRKLITEKEGFLVTLNPEEIAEAINLLMQNNKLCRELGRNAREKAINEHNIDKYLEYFYSLENL